jgi:hypothetical protein
MSGQLHSHVTLPLGKEPAVRIGLALEPVWTTWRRDNFWTYRDSNCNPSVFQLVVSRYTDCTIPTRVGRTERSICICKCVWTLDYWRWMVALHFPPHYLTVEWSASTSHSLHFSLQPSALEFWTKYIAILTLKSSKCMCIITMTSSLPNSVRKWDSRTSRVV